jgi:hypothetical protein
MTPIQRIRSQAADAVRALGHEPTPDAVADYLAGVVFTLAPNVSLAFMRINPKPAQYAVPPKPEPPAVA